jgi:hypothetical protein
VALIVIQAGHYPRKAGATGTGGLDGDPTEQEFNIAAAHACASALADAGHTGQVIWADVGDDAYRGDAFVAIHCDGSTSSLARGASVGYRTAEGQRFATAWKNAYQAAGWTGGWRPDNYTAALAGYYGTRNAADVGNRTAFVAEAGFLTNPTDEAQLSLPGGPERFARALAVAVVDLFGGQAPEVDMPLTDDDLGRVKTVVRAVLDEGTAFGNKGWADTNRSILTVGQAAYNNTNLIRAALGDVAPDKLAAAIAAAILAKMPAGGDVDQATVEAGVRAVLADALDG